MVRRLMYGVSKEEAEAIVDKLLGQKVVSFDRFIRFVVTGRMSDERTASQKMTEEPAVKVRVRVRHWWSGRFAPYRFKFHDHDSDAPLDKHELFRYLLENADVQDGEMVEISVRRVGNRDTEGRWELTEPHHYERVTT